MADGQVRGIESMAAPYPDRVQARLGELGAQGGPLGYLDRAFPSLDHDRPPAAPTGGRGAGWGAPAGPRLWRCRQRVGRRDRAGQAVSVRGARCV